MLQHRFFACTFLLALGLLLPARAQETVTRTVDSSLTQKYQSDFGYSFMLPAKAKLNPIGSDLNRAGQSQLTNFILPGGSGSLKIRNYKEQQVVPPGYKMLDSMVFFQRDSMGVNGRIVIRNYILREMSVQMEVLLTAKGEKEYGGVLNAMLDSFLPPADQEKALHEWRYERGKDRFKNNR